MEEVEEDSPLRAQASIEVLDALQTVSAQADPAAAVRLVLDHARRALRAERAFLVEDAVDAPRVLAMTSIRGDGPGAPSRTAARRLLAAGARRSEVALDGDSVRALQLRAVLGAPLPCPGPRRRALVLDSRHLPDPVPSGMAATLEGFAALLGLVARQLPPAPSARDLEWVGESRAYLALRERIRAVAGSTLPVLIAGESGTGKDGVARRIHASGTRASGPFVAVNCAAVPESLLEGELFGSVRGAYTGADRDRVGLFSAADRGTLFLDEVGDMPLPMQAKLLRVLQEGRLRPVGSASERAIDVRVLAASHRDLRQACQQRSFRADLLYRLAVLEVHVPPLRARLADLPLLAPFLLDKLAARAAVPPCTLSSAALAALTRHPWPGNVRELESVLARAAVRIGGGILGPEHLDLVPADEPLPREIAAAPGETLERAMVRAALAASSGSMTAAAARIGWTRQKLYRRMLALGLYEEQPRERPLTH